MDLKIWSKTFSTAGILGGWSRKSASSRARTTSTLKSINPTARVGNNEFHELVCVCVCDIACRLGLQLYYLSYVDLGGWALQGYLVVGHESQLPVGRGQHLL